MTNVETTTYPEGHPNADRWGFIVNNPNPQTDDGFVRITLKGGDTLDCPVQKSTEKGYNDIIVEGLTSLSRKGKVAKESVKGLEGADLEAVKAKIARLTIAYLGNVLDGNMGTRALKAKASKGLSKEVQTMAIKIATRKVKDTLKANKERVSDYKPAQLRQFAQHVLADSEDGPIIVAMAQEAIAAQANLKLKRTIDLTSLKPDPTLVAKNKAVAAERKSDKPKPVAKVKAKPTVPVRPVARPTSRPTIQ